MQRHSSSSIDYFINSLAVCMGAPDLDYVQLVVYHNFPVPREMVSLRSTKIINRRPQSEVVGQIFFTSDENHTASTIALDDFADYCPEQTAAFVIRTIVTVVDDLSSVKTTLFKIAPTGTIVFSLNEVPVVPANFIQELDWSKINVTYTGDLSVAVRVDGGFVLPSTKLCAVVGLKVEGKMTLASTNDVFSVSDRPETATRITAESMESLFSPATTFLSD